MFDIGGSELLVIAVVALIVVGPKELPGLLRTVGRMVAAIRQQAQQFREQFDEAIRDTEFEDLKKSVDDLKAEARTGFRQFEESVEKDVGEVRAAGDDIRREIEGETTKDHDLEWLDSYEEEAKSSETKSSDAPSSSASASDALPAGETAPKAINGTPSDVGAAPKVADSAKAQPSEPAKPVEPNKPSESAKPADETVGRSAGAAT